MWLRWSWEFIYSILFWFAIGTEVAECEGEGMVGEGKDSGGGL